MSLDEDQKDHGRDYRDVKMCLCYNCMRDFADHQMAKEDLCEQCEKENQENE